MGVMKKSDLKKKGKKGKICLKMLLGLLSIIPSLLLDKHKTPQ